MKTICMMLLIASLFACNHPTKTGDNAKVEYLVFLGLPADRVEADGQLDFIKGVAKIAHGGNTLKIYLEDATLLDSFDIPEEGIVAESLSEFFLESAGSLSEKVTKRASTSNNGSVDLSGIVRKVGDERLAHPNLTIRTILVTSPWPNPLGETIRQGIPPDAAFCAANSPFYVKPSHQQLGVPVHIFFTSKDELIKDRCTFEQVKRWWTAYFGAYSAEVLTFTGDLKDYDRLNIQGLTAEKTEINCSKTTVELCDAPVFDIQSLAPPEKLITPAPNKFFKPSKKNNRPHNRKPATKDQCVSKGGAK